MNKKIFLALSLGLALGTAAIPTQTQASVSPRTAAIIIGSAITGALICEGGHYLYTKGKAFAKFCKEKPWWPLAGLTAGVGCVFLANDALRTLRII